MRTYTGCIHDDLEINLPHDPELVRIVTELADQHLGWTFGDQPEAIRMIISTAATAATVQTAFWTYDLQDFFPDKVVPETEDFWRLLIDKYHQQLLLIHDLELRKVCII
jgi:hypothetical protein